MKQSQSSSQNIEPERSFGPFVDVQSTKDDIDLNFRELLILFWKGKWVIFLSTLVFAIAGLSYALTAQELWTSKAKITLPQIQDYSNYQLQVKQFQLVFDVNQDDGSILISEELDELLEPEKIFEAFITAFNSTVNKVDFLDSRKAQEEYRNELNTGENAGDTKMWLYAGSVNRVSAVQADRKVPDIYQISVQSTDKYDSYTTLTDYIAYIKNKVTDELLTNLKVIVDNKKSQLEQHKRALMFQANQRLTNEIKRAEYALQIAKAANVERPLQSFGADEIFPINLGSAIIEEKIKVLNTIRNLSVIEPGIEQLDSKLSMILNTRIDYGVDFDTYRYTDEPQLPIKRDKPNRLIIAVISALMGGILGICGVLVMFVLGIYNKQ